MRVPNLLRPLLFLLASLGLVAGSTAASSAHDTGYRNPAYERAQPGDYRYRHRHRHRRGFGVGVGAGVRFGHAEIGIGVGAGIRSHRRYRGRHGHRHGGYRGYRVREIGPSYRLGGAPRTRFCRKEWRGHRKVKRCILVRNDLLGRYVADGWSRH